MELNEDQSRRAREKFNEARENMDEDGVNQAAESGARKVEELDRCVPEVFLEIWDDIKTMVALLYDWIRGDYSDIPWYSLAAIAAAVAYFACPVDAVPDVIPGLGYLDDVLIIKICLDLVRQDLSKYRQWRGISTEEESQEEQDEPENDQEPETGEENQ